MDDAGLEQDLGPGGRGILQLCERYLNQLLSVRVDRAKLGK